MFIPSISKACDNIFNYDIEPIYRGKVETKLLCNTEFATLYIPILKVPMYSYEHVVNKNNVARQGSFKVDKRLDNDVQSTNKDYTNSGYDRGHLAPSGDMTSKSSQDETFLLSNIAPQNSKLNQQAWRLLEAKVKHNYDYIVTGVIFQGNTIKTIGNGVGVPTQFYKIVSDGKTCSTSYIADNIPDSVIKEIDLHDLEDLTKISFYFPYNHCR